MSSLHRLDTCLFTQEEDWEEKEEEEEKQKVSALWNALAFEQQACGRFSFPFLFFFFFQDSNTKQAEP